MKILYAIQATGNGHISRALEIIPYLQQKGDLDLLLSGTESQISLPYHVKHRFLGASLILDKKGGVSYLNTYLKNHIRRFIKEVRHLPIEEYDIVINDFEPISAWAAYMKKKTCIALSNQCAVLADTAPKPDHDDKMGRFVINNYAPATAHYGFHFARYAENIYTPIIRREIRDLKVTNRGHYTVYLPAYSDEKLIDHLGTFEGIEWEVFSKTCHHSQRHDNVLLQPINKARFMQSIASCKGVLCAAGFATPSEALFLGKKLMVIPMKWQYEQQCNAAALSSMGVPVLKSLKRKRYPIVEDWLLDDSIVQVDYPDITGEIIDLIFERHFASLDNNLTFMRLAG